METGPVFDQKVSVVLYKKDSDLNNRYFNEFFSKIEKTIPNNGHVLFVFVDGRSQAEQLSGIF